MILPCLVVLPNGLIYGSCPSLVPLLKVKTIVLSLSANMFQNRSAKAALPAMVSFNAGLYSFTTRKVAPWGALTTPKARDRIAAWGSQRSCARHCIGNSRCGDGTGLYDPEKNQQWICVFFKRSEEDGEMECRHKPKEFIKAAFYHDYVFTCKKCGQDIFWVSYFEFQSISWICSIIKFVSMGIIGSILSIFLEYDYAWLIGGLVPFVLVDIGKIIYMNKVDGCFTTDPKD